MIYRHKQQESYGRNGWKSGSPFTLAVKAVQCYAENSDMHQTGQNAAKLMVSKLKWNR
jgi:hypothetical protein